MVRAFFVRRLGVGDMAERVLGAIAVPTEGQTERSYAAVNEALGRDIGTEPLALGVALALRTMEHDPDLMVSMDRMAKSASLAQAFDAADASRPSMGAGEVARFIVVDTQMMRYADEAMGMDLGARETYVSREVVAARRPEWADGMSPSSLARLDGADLSWYSTGHHEMMSERGLRTISAAHEVGLASRDSRIAEAVYATAVREGFAPEGLGADKGMVGLDEKKLDPFRPLYGIEMERAERAAESRAALDFDPVRENERRREIERGTTVAGAMMQATHVGIGDRAALEGLREATGLDRYSFDDKLAGYRGARTYLEEKGIATGDGLDLEMMRVAVQEEVAGRSPSIYDLARGVTMTVRAGELLEELDGRRPDGIETPASKALAGDGGTKMAAVEWQRAGLKALAEGRELPGDMGFDRIVRTEMQDSGYASGLFVTDMSRHLAAQEAAIKAVRDREDQPERKSGLFAQIKGMASEVKDRVMPKGRVDPEPQISSRDRGRDGGR